MKVVVLLFVVFLSVAPMRAAVVSAAADAYVRYSGGSGTESHILLQEHVPGNNYGKGYLKFDVSFLPEEAMSATLDLTYSQRNAEGLGRIGVYGILDSANLDGWGEAEITTVTAPANLYSSNDFTADAVYLGEIIINTSNGVSAVGDHFTLSSVELTEFLNTDTDGQVTIALNFEVLDGVQNFSIWVATRENTLHAEPSLDTLSSVEPVVAPAFEILEGGENFVMGWASQNGLYYVLEDRTSLMSGAWQYKGSILGVGGGVALTNFMSGPQGFYRISPEEFVQWQINENDPGNPLVLAAGNQSLGILSGLGPVYDYEGGILSPGNYAIELLSSQRTTGGGCVYVCRASYGDFEAEYTLELNPLDANTMELLIDGTDNVWSFKIGNISGLTEPCKLFYTGEREAEARLINDNYSGLIYLPSSKLFLHGSWDKDYTNARIPQNRTKPKQNFLAIDPAPTTDAFYALLTDGTRQPLKERYVFRFGKDPWQAYGPVQNKPSPYGSELAEMVYFDGWVTNFCYGIAAFEFLNEAIPEEVGFYTSIQHWAAWSGWDMTNPDAFRTPDHVTPWPAYGTTTELHRYLSLAQARGYAGFRYNYLHIGRQSWSVDEGSVQHALTSDGSSAWYANLATTKPLVATQEADVQAVFSPTAAFHDQWGSAGSGAPIVNYDATAAGAGKLSAIRRDIREACQASKGIHGGPLASESLFSEYLFGEYVDTGDFCIYGGDQRHDFSPEYKLRRLHGLTTVHSMGLGWRYFYSDGWITNKPLGTAKYFGSDEELDSYRACEVLYGNGGYLYAKASLRKVHMLTECLTVGLAQRYYAMQPVDFVEYSTGGDFARFHEIIDQSNSLAELQAWYGRFHIRYRNGCHVWVNRDPDPLEVTTPNDGVITLAQHCWLVYMENGTFSAYTAEVDDPVVTGLKARVDFCEDKNLGIKYANPRTLTEFKGASAPTVWQAGQVRFVLSDPNTTLEEMCQ